MLFFKLYNWLKYKTTPSSFLFKNRLFVERDSKHRKVMNNFGLVYRNSKWSNYENINVNSDFKDFYFKFFARFFLLLFGFFLFFSSMFKDNSFFNSISFLFFLANDSVDYYVSFTLWSFLSFLTLSFNKLYLVIVNYKSTLGEKNFSTYPDNGELDSTQPVINSSIKVSKYDLNWLVYSWLGNVSSENKYGSHFVELLFDSNVSKTHWNMGFDFFFNLNLSSFFLNLHNKDFYFYKTLFKDMSANNSKNIVFFFDNTDLMKNHFDSLFSFNFKSYGEKKNNFSSYNNLTHTGSNWNLNNLSFSDFNYIGLDKNKHGSFYINNYTYTNFLNTIDFKNINDLFYKNLILSESLKSSLNFGKWNRWLYRYSLLHRKSIKFGQKLTFTKKLLDSGFYNSSIFKKNIWNSNIFNFKNMSSTHMTTFFDTYFNDYNVLNFFNKSFINSSNKTFAFNDSNSLLSLKFLESSYFWSLKRFFLFNGLENNNSFFKIKWNTNTLNYFFKNKFTLYFDFFYLNIFFKNRTFSLQTFNQSEQFFLDLNNNLNNFNNGAFLNENNDVFLSSFDIDIFSKENLTFVSTLSSNLSNTYFYRYIDNLDYSNKNIKLCVINKKNLNTFWTKVCLKHLLNSKIDFFFFKDLFLFFEFYNK